VPRIKGCAASKPSSGASASKASRILNTLDPGSVDAEETAFPVIIEKVAGGKAHDELAPGFQRRAQENCESLDPLSPLGSLSFRLRRRRRVCHSLAIGEGRDLGPVPTEVHATPDARSLLARVIKMKYTATAFSNARYGDSRQQVRKCIRERRECMLRNLRSEVPASLKPSLPLSDLLQVRVVQEQPVEVLQNTRRNILALFSLQYSLTNPLPELPKFLNAGRELRR